MRRTIYLPDELSTQVDEYLKRHPGLTLSGLVREVLEARVSPRDPRSILKLAGIVKKASMTAREYDENPFGRREG
jgi:hypothetical protein